MTQNVRILPNFILSRSFKWWKISFLSQIFNMNQIFWILSNFIFCWFAGQECQFWAKNSRQLKISGFSQISFFAGPEWSNSQFWSKFSPRLKISEFCQISSCACSERSEMSVLSQIFNTTENCRIFPNFILRRSLVVKNVNFEPNFQLDSKCLHFAKFILRMFWVVKNVGFEPTFQHNWKFQDFAQFHPLQVLSGQKSHFELNFEHGSKFLDFVKFHPSQVRSGQNSQFWAKVSAQLEISGCCQISSFPCLSCQ